MRATQLFISHPMQLFILGPAFGLPSIDAECLAAVALLQLHRDRDWELVPSSNQSLRLPCLIDDNRLFEGYESIAKHVNSLYDQKSKRSTGSCKADGVAISSFVRVHGQPLLDISLYVSSENYSTTRSAFTKILPWYMNYLLPPRRRAAARTRTQHLGISSIDVEEVHEDLSNRPASFDNVKEPQFEAETQKRASLILPRKDTVLSLLRRPEHSAVFKLHTLADNFFGALQDMLEENEHFLGTDEPNAIDCLIYGYLGLMLYPTLPQDWLAKTMRRKYSKLVLFTEQMHERCKTQMSTDNVTSLMRCHGASEVEQLKAARAMTLPWMLPPPTPLRDAAKAVILELAALMPMMHRVQVEIVPAVLPPPKPWSTRYIPAGLAIALTSLGMFGYHAFSTGLLVWPQGEAVHVFGRKRLADYGHLGAALAGSSFLLAPGIRRHA